MTQSNIGILLHPQLGVSSQFVLCTGRNAGTGSQRSERDSGGYIARHSSLKISFLSAGDIEAFPGTQTILAKRTTEGCTSARRKPN